MVGRIFDALDLAERANLLDRVGRQPGRCGYVHETDAQVEVLQETVQPFLDDLARRAVEGHVRAATELAVGLVAGLYELATSAPAETLIGWGDSEQNARDLVDGLLLALKAASVDVPKDRFAVAAPTWADATW